MPTIKTPDFGPLEFQDADVFHFPEGLPGFESETRFLLLTRPDLNPFCFLQSARQQGPRFIGLSAHAFDPGIEVGLAEEEAQLLGVEQGIKRKSSADVLILLLVTIPAEGAPTVNLAAPVLLAQGARRGLQTIRPDCGLPAGQPLSPHSAEEV